MWREPCSSGSPTPSGMAAGSDADIRSSTLQRPAPATSRLRHGRIREAVRGAPEPTHWLVFDAQGVTHVDSTGIEPLRALARELEHDAVRLVVARMSSYIKQDLDEAGVTEEVRRERVFPTVRAAVDYCVKYTDQPKTTAAEASPV